MLDRAFEHARKRWLETATAGAMALTGATGRRTALLVTPLPRRFGEAAQRVLLTLRLADGAPLADAATLVAVFGLTPAEAAVARLPPVGGQAGD